MRVVRAIELAAFGNRPVKGERIADAQGIPLKFLGTSSSTSSTPAS